MYSDRGDWWKSERGDGGERVRSEGQWVSLHQPVEPGQIAFVEPVDMYHSCAEFWRGPVPIQGLEKEDVVTM